MADECIPRANHGKQVADECIPRANHGKQKGSVAYSNANPVASVVIHATSHRQPRPVVTTAIPASRSITGMPTPSAAYIAAAADQKPLNGVNNDRASLGANMTTPSTAQGRV